MIQLFLPFFTWCERFFVGGLILSLVIPVTIVAYFSDTEIASTQGFTASELRFATTPGLAEEAFLGVGLTPESVFPLPTALTAASSEAKLDIVGSTVGDELFCTALQLSAAGYLGTISDAASRFASQDLTPGGEWEMTLRYTKENVLFTHGDTCLVTITMAAWQANMSKENAGYHDAYTYTAPVRAHLVVLNEVLPRPQSGETEFIELYNNSDAPIDVAGWNITEKTGSGATINHSITSSSTGAGALVAYDGSRSTIIPARGTLALKYQASSYLNDSGDTLSLIDADGYFIDEFSYTDAVVNMAYGRTPDGSGPWTAVAPTPNELYALLLPTILEPELFNPEVTSLAIAQIDEEAVLDLEADLETASGTLSQEDEATADTSITEIVSTDEDTSEAINVELVVESSSQSDVSSTIESVDSSAALLEAIVDPVLPLEEEMLVEANLVSAEESEPESEISGIIYE